MFTLKIESVYKITIFGLKMMVKSGLEKKNLKFLNAEAIFFKFILLHKNEDFCKFSNKNGMFAAWWDFKKKFCGECNKHK